MGQHVENVHKARRSPAFLKTFAQDELALVEEYIEDTVVYQQLHNYPAATASLHRANVIMDIVELYLSEAHDERRGAIDRDQLSRIRQRIVMLSRAISH